MLGDTEKQTCWICGGDQWKLFKPSTLGANVTSDDFRITDAHYGHTGRIEQCQTCGFKQCHALGPLLGFYGILEVPPTVGERSKAGLNWGKFFRPLGNLAPEKDCSMWARLQGYCWRKPESSGLREQGWNHRDISRHARW